MSDLAALCHQLYIQPCGPVAPGGIGQAEGVAVHFDVVDGGHHLVTGELALHQDQVPPHLQDLVDMLDVGRADLLAGPAGGA